ncbi:MAG: ATP-binding protein [Thermoprotei archaeon]|nr:MAG: ATP-binding protein [Thermoprotei archaeon]
MYGTLKLVGRIVGEASPTEFLFVADKENHPPKYEYVAVFSRELIGDSVEQVQVLAQVTGVVSRSLSYREDLDLEALERICRAGIDDVNVICRARTLGYIAVVEGRKEILMPRRAIYPGNEVFLAPDKLVTEFFSYSREEGLHVGYLISRPKIPVFISVNGFKRHLAILAQTGAGKSYTVGVLVEELLKKGATVVIIDPHADYVFLSRKTDGTRYEYANRIKVFRNPNSTGRYSRSELDNVYDYTIRFSDLSGEDICDVLGILDKWTNIRNAIIETVKELKEEIGEAYTPEHLIEKMEEKSARNPNALKALKYVRKLKRLRVFGAVTTSISEMLKPAQVSVVDLSGLNDPSMDYIVFRILSEIFYQVSSRNFGYPVFVFIEEAHKFIPRKNIKKLSRDIINTIAAEGRKFGVFMTLISQRPSKIDPDALSQCNSQIILKVSNPSDQHAIIESSERLSEDLLKDLPGLNVGEAVIVGEITKVPVMVKIRKRVTREGGADIDVVGRLKAAVEEAGLEEELEKEQELVITREDTMWSEV